jgi:hypothetical protein
MNAIFDFFRDLFGMDKDVSQITSPIGKVLKDLEKHSARHDAKAEKAKRAAQRLHDEKEARITASKEMKALAENYKGLVKS